ncbi:MAG: BamA/TamA family outer membrane protein [Polyangiaceae bacterium]
MPTVGSVDHQTRSNRGTDGIKRRFDAGWLAPLCLAGFVLANVGCRKREIGCSPVDYSGCNIDEVEIVGNEAVSDDEIEKGIATAATAHGIIAAVPVLAAADTLTVEYERFDRFVLERDLLRVARIYRAKGYYDAVVRAGRVRRIDGHDPKSNDVSTARIRVEIIVDEGEPVHVRDVKASWSDASSASVPTETRAAAEHELSVLKRDAVFTEAAYDDARSRIRQALTDRSFAYATVTPHAIVDLATHTADITYDVDSGPPCTFGEISIVGLETVPEWQIRPILDIEKGQPFDSRKLVAAEKALSQLGVFTTVSIQPRLEDSRPSAVPVTVRVQKAALGAVRAGFGLEAGSQVAITGVFGYSHKNATRALDRFFIQLKPRLLAYPWRLDTLFSTEPRPIPEVGTELQYSLPFPFDPPTSLFAELQASIGLERNTDAPDKITDTTDIQGEYLFEHRFGIQRSFFDNAFTLKLAHNTSLALPFSYTPSADQGTRENLLFSYLSLLAQLDFRYDYDGLRNSVRPEAGIYFATNLEVAGIFLGGDANDVKVSPELRWYAPLARHVTLAGRVAFGFLYTLSYGDTLDAGLTKEEVLASGTTAVDRDVAVLEKRGLFSGGPGSNRGYRQNDIAPHRTLADAGAPLKRPDAIGGRTLWETSLELRFPILAELGGTLFGDASDVTRDLGEFRTDHPHLSVGGGVRYETPIGPLRIDVAVRVPGAQVIGSAMRQCDVEKCTQYIVEEGTSDTTFELPLAISIAIGNTF